jgi:hypothetical protein
VLDRVPSSKTLLESVEGEIPGKSAPDGRALDATLDSLPVKD